MQQLSFIKHGWFIAALLLALFAAGKASHIPLFEQLEGMLYDSSQGFSHRVTGSTKDIVIVRMESRPTQEPDQRFSLRQKLADLLDIIAAERPKSVALMVPLSTSQPLPGAIYFESLKHFQRVAWGKRQPGKFAAFHAVH